LVNGGTFSLITQAHKEPTGYDNFRKNPGKIIFLPPKDKIKLFKWFADLDGQLWDEQIENDFQEGERGKQIARKG